MSTADTISPAELANRYGVSAGTLANWRAQDKGPPHTNRGGHRNGRVSYPRKKAIEWGKANGYIQEEK